jgi:hypothetical protein
MVLYLILGMCFGMFIEMAAIKTGVEPMTMPQRFGIVLLWPIFLLYFVIEMLK